MKYQHMSRLGEICTGNVQVSFDQSSRSWWDYSRTTFTWNHGQGLQMICETKLLQQSPVCCKKGFQYCYLSIDVLFNSPHPRQGRNKPRFSSHTFHQSHCTGPPSAHLRLAPSTFISAVPTSIQSAEFNSLI